MKPELNEAEVRVLGALIEKEITTPDYYPLSLNALTNACNQSSNRNPVVQFDEDTVARSVDSLREKKMAHVVQRSDSRILKYRHVIAEATVLEAPQIAVMCILMLRGPQTVGEIRTRCNRLHDFNSLDDVEATLTSLIAREPEPLVVRLPRRTGQKEVRYAHLFSGAVSFHAPEADDNDRIGKLEENIAELRSELHDLQKQFNDFRKQLE